MPREVHELPEDDPEIKRDVRVQATAVKRSGDYLDTMREIGTWKKMVGCTAVWLRYMEVLRRRIKKEQIRPWSGVIDVSYREEAITQLTRLVQRDELSEEYYALKSRQYPHERDEVRDRRHLLKSSSNLFRLDVYMDTDSTLRVGGRLRRGELSYEAKHPRVVPQSSFLAKAIMQDCHEKSGHSGQNGSLGRTRGEGWWILRGKRVARKICRDCVLCKRMKGVEFNPKMSDLPADRIAEAPAFTYCGADLLGPVLVKYKRGQQKRWICLFTCLSMRAVHLEVCEDLSTDSYLNAYRRMVARRGPVRLLRSDRGTNLMGAKNEHEKELGKLDPGVLKQRLAVGGCDYVEYKPNTPRAPHQGGAWERLVRSVKNGLSTILKTHSAQLDDWTLLTLLAEVEATINSRPLTYVDSEDTDAPVPLTPMQLITMKGPNVPPPPGEFPEEDVYGRKRWRRVQYLASQFWIRWRRDYLLSLQTRNKWEANRD